MAFGQTKSSKRKNQDWVREDLKNGQPTTPCVCSETAAPHDTRLSKSQHEMKFAECTLQKWTLNLIAGQ